MCTIRRCRGRRGVIDGCVRQSQSQNQNTVTIPVSVCGNKAAAHCRTSADNRHGDPDKDVSIINEMAAYYSLQANPRTGKPFALGDQVKKDEVIIKLHDVTTKASTRSNPRNSRLI